MAFPIALRGEEARRPLYTVASLSNVSYLKLLRFNSSKNELSTDEDWSLSIWASYRGAIIYRLFRRRLMIISQRTHPDFSSLNDLREDRTIREFFLLLFYKRTALFLALRDSSPASHEIRAALNESANELDHTRWFYRVDRRVLFTHLDFERIEIVLLYVLIKWFRSRLIVSNCRIARPTSRVYAFHRWLSINWWSIVNTSW